MKRFLLASAICFSLTACETLDEFSWSDMNPFSMDEPVQEVTINSSNKPVFNPDTQALQTELAEMNATGTRVHLQAQEEPEIQTEQASADAEITESPMPEAVESPTEQATTVTPPAPEPKLAMNPAAKPLKKVTEPTIPDTTLQSAPAATAAEIQPQPATKTTSITEQVPPPANTVRLKEPMAAVRQTTSQQETQTTVKPLLSDGEVALNAGPGCPKILIMPAARSVTYFENALSGEKKARASIQEITGGCEIVDGGMEIDLNIIMQGTITNKGRFEGRKDKETFMTFPYFVAFATPQGLPIDKKILATAVHFPPMVDYIDHAEKITQFVPMETPTNAANYTITVGYQLTREQMEYNRLQSMRMPDGKVVAPDMQNRPRISTNPLKEE